MATLTVNYTAASPAPANGYIVRYREKGSTAAHTSVTATTNPIAITTAPDGTSFEGDISSSCGNGVTSTPVAFSVDFPYRANDLAFTLTYAGSGGDTHPAEWFKFTTTGVKNMYWDASGRPNRWTIYDHAGTQLATTGWVGEAAYDGPWGASLSTALTGNLGYTLPSGHNKVKVLIEVGPADPVNPVSDSATTRIDS